MTVLLKDWVPGLYKGSTRIKKEDLEALRAVALKALPGFGTKMLDLECRL